MSGRSGYPRIEQYDFQDTVVLELAVGSLNCALNYHQNRIVQLYTKKLRNDLYA